MNTLSIIKQTYINQLNALNYDLSDKYPSSWDKDIFNSSIKNIDLTNKKIIVEQYIDAIINGLNISNLEQNAYENSYNKLIGTKININELEQILNQYLMEHPDANLLNPFKNPLNDKSLLEKINILQNGYSNSFSSSIPTIDDLDNFVIPTVSINTAYLQNQVNPDIEELTNKHKNVLKQAHDEAENAKRVAAKTEQDIRNLQDKLNQARQNNVTQQQQIKELQQQLQDAEAAHQVALNTLAEKDAQIRALNDLHRIEMDELREQYTNEIYRINARNIEEHTNLENNNQQLQNQINELEDQLHEKGNLLNQTRKELDTKNNNIVLLEEELTRIKAARDLAIIERDDELGEKIDAQTERKRERIQINQDNIPLINRLQAQVDELEQQYREKDSALNQSRRDLDKIRNRVVQLEEELKQTKAARDLSIIKNDELREQYQNEIRLINANNIKEQSRLQKELDELIESKNETIANLQAIKQNILKDNSKSSAEKDALLLNINNNLQKEKDYIDNAKAKLIKNLENLNIKKNVLQDELNLANEHLRRNQSDMNFKDTLLSNLRKQTTDLRTSIDAITIERDQARQNLAKCKKTKGPVVEQDKELYLSARELLEEKELQLRDLKQKLEEANNLTATYYTKLLNKTSEVAATKAFSIAQISALRVNADLAISDLLIKFDDEHMAKIAEEEAKRKLEIIILELREQLKNYQKNFDVEHQSKIIEIQEKLRLQYELNELQDQLRQLTNQQDEQKNNLIRNYQEGLINARSNNDERIERYQKSIQECEQRIKEKQQLIATKDIAILEANDKLTNATSELAKKTSALEKSQKEANKYIIELRKCREDSLQLRKEKESLESRLQEMIGNLSPNLADLQKRLTIAEQKNSVLSANNETTDDELSASQFEISRLSGEIASNIAIRAGKDIELNNLRLELDLTKRKLESIGELQKQLTDAKQDTDTAYGLLNTMMKRKDELESKIDELQSALNTETQRAEALEQVANADVQELNKRLSSAQDNIDTERRYSAAAQEEITRLEKELESTKLELSRTRTEIKIEFTKKLDEAFAEIESKKDELRQVVLDKDEAIKASKDAAVKIENLESKIKELESNDDTDRAKIKDLDRELEREIDNRQSLELLLNQKTTEYAAAIATIIAKHAALETLSKTTLRVITKERDTANEESARLRLELESLSDELKNADIAVKRAQEASAAIISGQTTAAQILLAEQARTFEAITKLSEIKELLATTQLTLDETTTKFIKSEEERLALEQTLDKLRLNLVNVTKERDEALAETEEVKRQCNQEQTKLQGIATAAIAETQRIQRIQGEKDIQAEKILNELRTQCELDKKELESRLKVELVDTKANTSRLEEKLKAAKEDFVNLAAAIKEERTAEDAEINRLQRELEVFKSRAMIAESRCGKNNLDEDEERINQLILQAKLNLSSNENIAISTAKLYKDQFKQFLLRFELDQQKNILKIILSELQNNLQPGNKYLNFIDTYLKVNPIIIKNSKNIPKYMINNVSDFWGLNGFIFNWAEYDEQTSLKYIFTQPVNAYYHEFFTRRRSELNISDDIIIDFMLFLIDYIIEEPQITDKQLIKINKDINSNLTTLYQSSSFDEKFINYIILSKSNSGIDKVYQEGGSNNIKELLEEFISAYVMLRAPIYNKKDKVQTIKDMITSNIRSSIKIKKNKLVKIKIPLINDLLKIIMLPIFCESKGIKVTYENMFKCYKKNIHKLLSSKEINKYINLFKLSKEQKNMLRQYDRRVASMMNILL
jgi:chromosome segregation ATPase